MSKVKTIEFWLFALPALLAGAFLAGLSHLSIASQFVAVLAVAWVILAIAWMFRELVRWIRN